MWLILLLFPTAVFSIELDSEEQCAAFWTISKQYWVSTEQDPKAMCVRTLII